MVANDGFNENTVKPAFDTQQFVEKHTVESEAQSGSDLRMRRNYFNFFPQKIGELRCFKCFSTRIHTLVRLR
jgi:hypothetical protein